MTSLKHIENRKGRAPKGRWWGLGDFDLTHSKILKEPGACDAMLVYTNIRAHLTGANDNSVRWAYRNGPIPARNEKFERGVFHSVRLGLTEIVQADSFSDGKGKGRIYNPECKKWRRYDPDRPGAFILNSRYCPAKWKMCFDSEGRWKDGIDPRTAPNEKKKSPKNISLVRTSDHSSSASRTLPSPKRHINPLNGSPLEPDSYEKLDRPSAHNI